MFDDRPTGNLDFSLLFRPLISSTLGYHAAGLHPIHDPLLSCTHPVQQVCHLWPRLVSLVDDDKLVDGRVTEVHRAGDIFATVR